MNETYSLSAVGGSSSIVDYRNTASAIPLISKEMETNLAERLQENNDIDAARQLVVSHLRFVVYLAEKYKGYGLDMHDLIQEGNVGLMKAVKKFSPSFGVRLASFAVHYIKAEMNEFIIKNISIVKLATTKAQRKLFFNSAKLRTGRTSLSEDEVSLIASELNVPENDVLIMEGRLKQRDQSLNVSTSNDNEDEKINLVRDSSLNVEDSFFNESNNDSRKEKLSFAIDKLDERSKHILLSRYQEKKVNLSELAVHFSVSSERIRQIERNAIKKIQDEIREYA